MNPLLERLDRAIERGHIPSEVPYFRAERALLLARLGDLAYCRSELRSLREWRAGKTPAALNAWITLAEGLSDYFENLGHGAYCKARRAASLAASGRSPRIQALSLSWCAHLAFRQQDDAACVAHLSDALRRASFDHEDARARACLVAATAYQFVGDAEQARPWYAAARHHASQVGDIVTLSSINFNMAALQVMAVRLADCFLQPNADATRRALMTLEASSNLDHGVRMLALPAHTAMQQALALVAHERYADALALHEHSLGQALVEGLSGSESLFHADRAWCQWQLGRSDEARLSARAAESALVWATEAEERAVTHAVLGRVFGPLGLPDAATAHAQEAQAEWAVHQRRCDALRAQLQAANLESLEPIVCRDAVLISADVVSTTPITPKARDDTILHEARRVMAPLAAFIAQT